jgi:beta-xylosidase
VAAAAALLAAAAAGTTYGLIRSGSGETTAPSASPGERSAPPASPAASMQPPAQGLPPAANPAAPARIVLGGQIAPSPFVLLDARTYYLYSSSWGYSANLPVRTSTDLEHWSDPAEALPQLPGWALPGITWDPSVYRLGGRYVMYFSDALASDPGVKCIGVATGPGPLGPFTAAGSPFVCQLDHRGSIDPRVFADSAGRLWFIWKSDDNADVLGDEHTTIFSQRLSDDGLGLLGPRYRILHASQPWEGRIVESPQMVEAAGHDWLFFSGNWFNQPVYAIGVARCAGPAGPCANPRRPLIASNSQGQGPGEPSLFVDKGQVLLAYTPSHYTGQGPQPVALARVAFGPSGPYVAAP